MPDRPADRPTDRPIPIGDQDHTADGSEVHVAARRHATGPLSQRASERASDSHSEVAILRNVDSYAEFERTMSLRSTPLPSSCPRTPRSFDKIMVPNS